MCQVALIVLAAAAPAFAQPRVELSGIIGWTFSDGVTGQAVLAGDGNIYDEIDVADSFSWGFGIGVLATENAEVGRRDGRRDAVLHDLGRGRQVRSIARDWCTRGRPVDADLHQVGRGRLVVRSLLGLLRRRRRAICESVRVQWWSDLSLLSRGLAVDLRRWTQIRSAFIWGRMQSDGDERLGPLRRRSGRRRCSDSEVL